MLVGGEDATLRDLRILAGELTIDAFGAVELAARTTMAGVHVEGNQVGVHAEFSHGTTIRNSTFAGNGTGVFVKVGRDFVVRASRFLDNVHAGLLLWDDQVPGSVTDGLVTRNHFEGNGIGLDLAAEHGVTGNHVVGNQFRRNRGSGMAVTVLAGHGGGVGTVVEDNHFDRNGFDPPTLHRTIQLGGSPFDPDPAPPETVTFVADGGLKVVARPAEAAGITVTGNRAFFNAGLGIDAPGVVDGGGNHGRHNSDGAECDGVRCQPGRP